MAECFICGKGGDGKVELKRKRFQVMYYWCIEWICRECFELESGEERDGSWEDAYDGEI